MIGARAIHLWWLSAAFVACGGGGATSPTPPTEARVQTFSLDYPIALLARGQPLTLQPTLKDAAGNVLTGKTISWTSSDPAIVRVEATATTGALTAMATGAATVTGTVDGVSATSTVSVVAIASVSAGPLISCAITTEGKLYCAGSGYGPMAQLVAPTLRFTAVSSNGQGPGGTAQTCALATDASAWCWGANAAGQLGTGDVAPRSAPTRVAGNIQFSNISVGRDYSCGLSTAGDGYCWGDGSTGQLGNGNTSGSMVPGAVAGGIKFTQLEAGSGTTCALTSAGQAYCWGRNDLGQLGAGRTGAGNLGDQSLVPVAVGDPLASVPLKQIVTRGPKTCALTSGGSAYCWGNNTVFELGASTSEQCYGEKPCSTSPLAIQSNATFTSLAASQFATCGITTTNETRCWGMDYQRLFGAATVPACPISGSQYGCTAAPVAGPSGMRTLSGSNANYCGIGSDGIAYCWGGNDFGQRGWPGSSADPTPRPFSILPTAER